MGEPNSAAMREDCFSVRLAFHHPSARKLVSLNLELRLDERGDLGVWVEACQRGKRTDPVALCEDVLEGLDQPTLCA